MVSSCGTFTCRIFHKCFSGLVYGYAQRKWLLRTSIVLNIIFVFYFTLITYHVINNDPRGIFYGLTGGSNSRHLRKILKCFDKSLEFKIVPRGNFRVLYNYVPAKRSFACHESVTYVTQGDFNMIHHLETTTERWEGPISMAMYAPGSDFNATIASIRYLRKCASPQISERVSFHVYFDADHLPPKMVQPEEVLIDSDINCNSTPPWYDPSFKPTYRTANKLLYPINVGRNVARDGAQTHFLLVADIELFPSANMVSDFLEMIRNLDPNVRDKKRKVFVLNVFEVEESMQPPMRKEDLVPLLANGSAITFHKLVAPECHAVPRSSEWPNLPIEPGLHIFHFAKREGPWEPVYIGTNAEPYYDERLTWEGRMDKILQCSAMCLLDYDLLILDNAFLVHRPGFKTYTPDPAREILASQTKKTIQRYIHPEIKFFHTEKVKHCLWL